MASDLGGLVRDLVDQALRREADDRADEHEHDRRPVAVRRVVGAADEDERPEEEDGDAHEHDRELPALAVQRQPERRQQRDRRDARLGAATGLRAGSPSREEQQRRPELRDRGQLPPRQPRDRRDDDGRERDGDEYCQDSGFAVVAMRTNASTVRERRTAPSCAAARTGSGMARLIHPSIGPDHAVLSAFGTAD